MASVQNCFPQCIPFLGSGCDIGYSRFKSVVAKGVCVPFSALTGRAAVAFVVQGGPNNMPLPNYQ